uniref:Uncharacterized protein n=1 Tax=Arundo donax TaxID=35708 RepID=A0A0A9BZW4_ARUDO
MISLSILRRQEQACPQDI